jgi:hypothetical protein
MSRLPLLALALPAAKRSRPRRTKEKSVEEEEAVPEV